MPQSWDLSALTQMRRKERRKHDLQESLAHRGMNIFAIVFSIPYSFPKPPWPMMTRGGLFGIFNQMLRFLNTAVDGGQRLISHHIHAAVAAWPWPKAWAGLPISQSRGRCCFPKETPQKCQTASCRCQLFMAQDIYQREELSPPNLGLSSELKRMAAKCL